MFSHLWSCIRGHRVYRVYTAGETEQSQPYASNPLEHGSQQVIKGVTILANIGLYVSPIVLLYLWRRDYTMEMACVSVAKLTAGFTLLVLVSMVIRGIGRSLNPSYNSFIVALKEAETVQKRSRLPYSVIASKYDCDFSALPVSYKVDPNSKSSSENSFFTDYFTVGGLASHVFGRHLIYPGSIRLLQAALGPYLEEGRTNLITKSAGKRAKVATADGNFIDTIFIDRRDKSKGPGVGSTLVLCCEGNAGFYEVGIVSAPLTAGYSVLGWNTPGFAYTTGLPFPSQVENGVDAVMQFAINGLGFTPDNILIYGWSIGGYPASWVAQRYPDIRGLILDATFDHVLPLALPKMPALLAPVVESAIMGHFNLCVADHTSRYYGPITIIRRKKDEIITTVEGDISTNRGNELLETVLLSRYPALFRPSSAKTLRSFINAPTNEEKARLLSAHGVDSDQSLAVLRSFFAEDGPAFPSTLGEGQSDEEIISLLLFLATKLLLDVEGGHTAPLEPRVFKQPWSVVADTSFEQVE